MQLLRHSLHPFESIPVMIKFSPTKLDLQVVLLLLIAGMNLPRSRLFHRERKVFQSFLQPRLCRFVERGVWCARWADGQPSHRQ